MNPTTMNPTTETNPFPKNEAQSFDTTTRAGTGVDDAVNRAVQGAHRAVDRVAERAVPAVERLKSGVNEAAGVLQARAGQLDEARERWVGETRNYVREHPLATVGGALVAGMVLARMLWR